MSSKNAAAVYAIVNTLSNSNPPINIDVLNDGKKINISDWTNADADEAHRAILRLEALQETKNIMYKQVIDRYAESKRSFNDEITTMLFQVKKAVEDFAMKNKDANSEHFDLPSGRVQFGHSSPLEITIDADALDKKLRELGKSADADLKACVKIEPVKNAIKAAIESKKIDGSWARIARVTNVKFKDNSAGGDWVRDGNGDADSDAIAAPAPEVPVGEKVAVAAEANPGATVSAQDTFSCPHCAKNAMGLSSGYSDIQKKIFCTYCNGTGRNQTPAPVATPVPAPASAPASAPVHAAVPSAVHAALQSASQIAIPAGIDFTKRPRIFEVPDLKHFTTEALETNRNSFEFMEISKLLEPQKRVTPDQLATMPIERIRDGMQKTTAELGFKRDDVRTWVAYHTGAMPADVAPAKFSDQQWRKLTALAIHAVAVRARHIADTGVDPSTGAAVIASAVSASATPATTGAPSAQG